MHPNTTSFCECFILCPFKIQRGSHIFNALHSNFPNLRINPCMWNLLCVKIQDFMIMDFVLSLQDFISFSTRKDGHDSQMVTVKY